MTPLPKHLPAESHAHLPPDNLFSSLNRISAHGFGYWGQAGGHQSFTAWNFDFVSTGRLHACQQLPVSLSAKRAQIKAGLQASNPLEPVWQRTIINTQRTHPHQTVHWCRVALNSPTWKALISLAVWEDSLSVAPKSEDTGMDTHWRREMTC